MIHKNNAYKRMQRERHIAKRTRLIKSLDCEVYNQVPGKLNKGRPDSPYRAYKPPEYKASEIRRACSMLDDISDADIGAASNETARKLKSIRNNNDNPKNCGGSWTGCSKQTVDIEDWQYRKIRADLWAKYREVEKCFYGDGKLANRTDSETERLYLAVHRIRSGIIKSIPADGCLQAVNPDKIEALHKAIKETKEGIRELITETA